MSETLRWQDSGQTEIFKGSKSFSLSSLFFTKNQKYGAWALYRWCRFVDDEVDLAPANEVNNKLAEIKKQTQLAFTSPQKANNVYKSLGWVAKNFSIQEQHTLDLIAGLEMDSQGALIQNEEDLLKYCYCVAGTVGLMMCAIMGVQDAKALPHADALGRAMQLTNIARDISEDLERNRIYIPRTWLQKNNVTIEVFSKDPEVRSTFALQLLNLAEKYYVQGIAGIPYLPFRAAMAVSSAAFIYRSIGLKIQKNPVYFQKHRATVPFYKKLFWILRGLAYTIRTRGH